MLIIATVSFFVLDLGLSSNFVFVQNLTGDLKQTIKAYTIL